MLKPMDSSSPISLTKNMIEQLYGGTTSTIHSYLGPEIVWVDTGHKQCFYGYYQVVAALALPPYRQRCAILHQQYHLTHIHTDATIVTGTYWVKKKSAHGQGQNKQYQSTFVWNEEASQYHLLHVHISPVSTSSDASNSLRFQGHHAETYFVSSDEILYIEAENINCNIHCSFQILPICQPMSQMEDILPEQFLRIHRSFIVNRNYVTRIYRYGVELSNGDSLPIPEKRYMEVVCRLENLQFTIIGQGGF